jgi:flagellar M-ring protein FliF
MDQIKQLIASLSIKQRVSIAIAAIAVVAALLSFSRWNKERDFKPLYTGLTQEDAAAVLVKVREGGSEFRLVEGGSTVLVPSAKVAELRLQLAAVGVPKSGRIGFELFDKTNFGTSDFAEQVNYHRAREGELERSVMAISEVEQARIHITFPKDSIFSESKQPAKASVLVKLRPGARLSTVNVQAICQLTASAVEGLVAEAVTVVDMRGNLLNRPRRIGSPDDPEPSEAALDYRQKLERDVLLKINATLEPLLGAEKFRAGASIECDFTSGDQSEETFDPAKSVMVTAQKTEDVSGGAVPSGVPGTPSNLPRPASRPVSGSSGVARRTENIAYQSSRLVRHTRVPQGAIKRISVSLILDQRVRWVGVGANARRIVEPLTPDRIKSIHDIVAAAIGFTPGRGDQLVVESMPFESTLHPAPPRAPAANPATGPAKPWDALLKDKKTLGIGAGAAVVVVILLAGVLRILRGKRRVTIEAAAGELPEAPPPPAVDLSKRIEAQLAEHAAHKQKQEIDALNALKLASVTTKKAEVLTKHIAEQAKKESTAMAQVVRTWLTDKSQ